MENLQESEASDLFTGSYYPSFSRKLVCIQYPAIVENLDRMLETIGGKSTLETVVGNASKKLELRFHPKNVFCKPCVADRDYKPGILLKVKIKQPKLSKEGVAGSSKVPDFAEPTVLGCEVVGVTAMSFKFNRLNDFQYLPLVPQKQEQEEKDTPLEYVYDKILPRKIPDIKWLLSEESQNMHSYLPPAIFSRFNTSYNKLHFEKSEIYNSTLRPELGDQLLQLEGEMGKDKRGVTSHKLSIMHSNRRSRKGYSIATNFNDLEIPKEPPEKVVTALRAHAVKDATLNKIKELFEVRPIWSKAAIAYKTGIAEITLKYVLPSVAYYFINGPWRVMWVRYGYDPRKDPSSHIYQTFDFRIRDMDTIIQRRRAKMGVSKSTDKTEKFSLKGDLKKKPTQSREIKENCFMLKPGIIPSGRQIFYQYCDMLLPEIQNMLARLPAISPEKQCDAKNGWLPDHFYDQCKEVAIKYVQEQAKKEFLEVRKQEQALLSDNIDSVDGAEVDKTMEDDVRIVIDDDSTDEELEQQEVYGVDEEEDVNEDEEEWNCAPEERNTNDVNVVEEVNRILEESQNLQQLRNDDIETKTFEAFAEMLKQDSDL